MDVNLKKKRGKERWKADGWSEIKERKKADYERGMDRKYI